MAKDLRNILLSEIEENKIKEKTPDKLPLNPTAMGWSGQEVRRFLAKSLIDNEGSFLAEFKKKMTEIKAQFEDVFGDGDGNIQGQIDGIIQDIAAIEENGVSELETIVLNNYNTLDNIKVNKTLTILGIDLEDDITLSEFKTALGDATTFTNGLMSALDKENLAQTIIDIQNLFSNKADKTDIPTKVSELNNDSGYITDYTETDPLFTAWNKSTGISITKSQVSDLIEATQALSGLMSATDKQRLDVLHALLEEDTENNVVDSINEVLSIFNNYPEGADLVSAFAGKVDKVAGKGLSTNDFTNNDKNKLDGIEAGAEVNKVNSVNGKQGVVVLNQDNVGDGATYKQVSQAEKNTWDGKQNKLVAGDNITIDENTNVISASGGGGEVDPCEMAYFNYASSFYGDKYSLLVSAWEHSLTVNPLDIGSAQYPNGTTEGVIIPHGVTSISNGAFSYWSANNQPLVIPDSVINIETGAFQYWTSNNQPLVIPNSVTSIGNYAFRDWESNAHPLVIPDSVTSIGQYAFERWSLVPHVEIHATTPPTLVNADAFSNQNNAPIYVPDESVDDYKEVTNWDMLANRIFPMSDKPDLGDLHENKLNKIWTDITEQPTTKLTDILVFNRGSNVYKTTVAKLLAQVDNEIFEVASVLPTTGLPNKIYLVPSSDPETQNTLDEFIWVNSAWEKIGAVSVDLSNYFNKAEINSLLDEKQDKLVAGNNITINPTTNVISASGGGGGGEVDHNEMAYFDYAGSIYGDKYSLLANAWGSSLAVYPLEISEESSPSSPRGTAQYPNGETEGVIVPHGVTTIGAYAFYNWTTNNQLLVIPESVTIIDTWAFSNWSANNQPLLLPNSVTNIREYAFRYWSSNNQPLTIQNGVRSIGRGAFNNWSSNNHPLIIPNSVISIGVDAFHTWSANNKPLVIPSSVTSISDRAFGYWEANTHPLVIPESVTNIGIGAFSKWLANNHPLVIPSSVTSIGSSAFSYWSLVPYIEIQATTPQTLGSSSAFNYQNDAPIYVPDGSVDDYKTATNWVDLASRIFPISDKPDDIDDILELETANIIKSITRSGSNLFTITYYDDTTSSLLTLAELKTFIGEATQSLSGLMSAQDKVDLDTLMALFDEDGDSVVNTIAEILAIFNNYPEGADLVTALAGKVDKVSGKGLSTNDLTNALKSNYDNAYTHSQSTHAPSNAQKNSDITKAEIEAKLTGEITSHSHALPTHTHTKSQITDFPTSMPPTAHNHDTDYYKKSEIDLMLGDIESALDAILGV